jgi:hypothetical protein
MSTGSERRGNREGEGGKVKRRQRGERKRETECGTHNLNLISIPKIK